MSTNVTLSTQIATLTQTLLAALPEKEREWAAKGLLQQLGDFATWNAGQKDERMSMIRAEMKEMIRDDIPNEISLTKLSRKREYYDDLQLSMEAYGALMAAIKAAWSDVIGGTYVSRPRNGAVTVVRRTVEELMKGIE